MSNARVTYRGLAKIMRGEAKQPQGWAKASKDAGFEMLRYWHLKFLPLHFEIGAYRRYGVPPYKHRREKLRYTDRRAGRRARLREPMVKTGTMKRLALRQIKPYGTSKSFKARIPGSRVANFHQGSSTPRTGGYEMRKELLVWSKGETEELHRFYKEVLLKRLNGDQSPVTHTL